MANKKHTTLMETYRKECKLEAKRILGIETNDNNS